MRVSGSNTQRTWSCRDGLTTTNAALPRRRYRQGCRCRRVGSVSSIRWVEAAHVVLAVLAVLGGLLAYNKVQDGHRLKASEADARAAETVAKNQSQIAADSESRAKVSEADARAAEAEALLQKDNALASTAEANLQSTRAVDTAAAAQVSEAKAKASEAAAKVSEDKALAAAQLAEKEKTEAEVATKRAQLAETRARVAEAATRTEVCGELVSTQSLLDEANQQLDQANLALSAASIAYDTLLRNTYNELGSIIASSSATVDDLKASLISLQGNYVVSLPSQPPLPSTC